MKDVLSETVLEKIAPKLREVGLLLVGWPGIGKTQFAKMLAMLFGDYWLDEKNIEGKRACWRRGKKIERFKQIRQEIHEVLLLDDPALAFIHFEDIKAYGELAEIGSGDSRYTDAKWCLNALRIILTNEFEVDEEPNVDEAVTRHHFFKMMRSTFGCLPEAHRLAIYKRFVTLIGGRNGLYLRMCSEDPNEPIIRYTDGNIANS